jgi:hypothetical protein
VKVDAILDFPQFDEGISKAVGHGCRAQLVRLTQYTDSLLQGSEEERMMAREVMMAPHRMVPLPPLSATYPSFAACTELQRQS